MVPEDPLFKDAVHWFWTTRDHQLSSQRDRGAVDAGQRSAVTGGKQMDGFARTIAQRLVDMGVPPQAIFFDKQLELPGFYRSTKQWDLIVITGGVLRAAIELKSHVGPSFSNNFNNRTEEALGTATDIWTAYREGAFQTEPAPWLGYLLLLEDCPQSRAPVRVAEPHFKVFPEFINASYATRYELFCRKLVRERQYNAACFLLADRTKWDEDKNYTAPAEDLGSIRFFDSLSRSVRPLGN